MTYNGVMNKNRSESHKGQIPWNKGRTGVYSAESLKRFRVAKLKKPTKFWLGKKREEMKGEKNVNWKGDKVGYFALHAWLNRVYGRPFLCEICKTDKKRVYHWANVSDLYLRDRSDWKRLCVPCHSAFDKNKKYGL